MNEEDPDYWIDRVQTEVRGVEFYYPNESRNPVPGKYAVVGPTSEIADSGISIIHAAMLFLATFRKDDAARDAADALVKRAG